MVNRHGHFEVQALLQKGCSRVAALDKNQCSAAFFLISG
jgi:hypothetical protein